MTRDTFKPLASWTAFAACWVMLPVVASAALYDVSTDFSATNNPNGVWTYGWSSSLLSPFIPHTGHVPINHKGAEYWGPSSTQFYPVIFHNPFSTPLDEGSNFLQPYQVALHPGPSGEYAVVRFTAPNDGTLSMDVHFSSVSRYGATADVHVLDNGVSLFDGLLQGSGDTASFSTAISVHSGDTVDYAVGYGSNQSYMWDGTGLDAGIQFTPVPAPSSLVIWSSLAAASAALGVCRRKRKNV